jgi:hypothetical protein
MSSTGTARTPVGSVGQLLPCCLLVVSRMLMPMLMLVLVLMPMAMPSARRSRVGKYAIGL